MSSYSAEKFNELAPKVDAAPRTWFEVFGRRTPAEFLRHIGSVEAANERLARARAEKIYDEHNWIELCLVPRSETIAILPSAGAGQIGVC